eukprot:6826156-Pyramimonas_sp.AAC.1
MSLRLSAAPPTDQPSRLHRSLMSARFATCPGSIGSCVRPRIEWFSLLRFKFVSHFLAQPWGSLGYQP